MTDAFAKKGVAKKQLHRWMAKWLRWLHIYLSMISLAAILFFSATGLTLNHPDWFFSEATERVTGQIDREWLHISASHPEGWDEVDYGHQVDKLKVAEFLRATHRLSGRVSDFHSFEDECEVTFQGPGYAATARISRLDGAYELAITCNDLVSVMNDFHKGRHTGPVWSLIIDISAIVAALVSLSGFGLVFYLKLHRPLRIVLSILGALFIVLVLYWLR